MFNYRKISALPLSKNSLFKIYLQWAFDCADDVSDIGIDVPYHGHMFLSLL